MCDSIGFMDINVEEQQQKQQTNTNLINCNSNKYSYNNNHDNSNNNNNNNNNSRSNTESETQEYSDNSQRVSKRKSISFDLNDEKIQKFIAGKTIIDQSNPFRHDKRYNAIAIDLKLNNNFVKKSDKNPNRHHNITSSSNGDIKKNQQYDKTHESNTEFITTEEVLKQSKYVKTYIKNPDPYFKYDPTILIRLKLEELKELALRRPPKKRGFCPTENYNSKYSKNIKYNEIETNINKVPLTYKKCSKVNYPDLADLKVKTGASDVEDGLLDIDEIAENVRKFDERVKKLNIVPLIDDDDNDDDDDDDHNNDDNDVDDNKENRNEFNEPNNDSVIKLDNNYKVELKNQPKRMQGEDILQKTSTKLINDTPSFNKMIKSQDFQNYLKKNGLTLQPKQTLDLNMNPTIESKNQVQPNLEQADNRKKSTVFRRLFSSRLFSKKSSHNDNDKPPERFTHERCSYHGHTAKSQPMADNILKNSKELSTASNIIHKPPRRLPIRKLSEGEMRISLSKRNESIKSKDSNRLNKQLNNILSEPTTDSSNSQSEEHYNSFKENIDSVKNKKSKNPPIKETETNKLRNKMVDSDESNDNSSSMPTSSTPIKKDRMDEAASESSLKLNSLQYRFEMFNDLKKWNKLREIKEHTDRELYQQVIRHQQIAKDPLKIRNENNIILPREQKTDNPQNVKQEKTNEKFVRNSPKRQSVPTMIHSNRPSQRNVHMINGSSGRSMSTERLRRTVNSECSHKNLNEDKFNNVQPMLNGQFENTNNGNNRKIGGILTREDILQKLKEFCRKSQNGTFFKNDKPLMLNTEERQPITQTGLSPVSYVSVETDRQSNFRNSSPQVPQPQQRKHSLPLPPKRQVHLTPIIQKRESIYETNTPSYACVMKRNIREQSKHFDSTEQRDQKYEMKCTTGDHYAKTHYKVETQPTYIQQNNLQYPQNEFVIPSTQQQVLINGENVLIKPVQIINNFPLMDINSQYQYVKPQKQLQQQQQQQQQQQLQIQHLPPNYCYIMVREPEIAHYQTAISPQPHLQIMPPVYYNNNQNNMLALERYNTINSKPPTVNQIYHCPTVVHHPHQQQQQQQHQQPQFWMPYHGINLM